MSNSGFNLPGGLQVGPLTIDANTGNITTSGNITVTGGGTFVGTINDTSVPTYAISPSTSSVNEGSSVTFTVTTAGVANGTTLYWTTTGTAGAADFSDSATTGTVVINSNSGTITRTLASDLTTEGSETFAIQLRTGSTGGTIQATSSTVTIGDTSLTPAASNVKLLLNMNGTNGSTTITDSSIYARTVSAGGAAQLSTSVVKYGTASAYFNGTNGYLSIPSGTDFNFGSGNFTVELWTYRTGSGDANRIFQFGTGDGVSGVNLFEYFGKLGVAMSSNGVSWDLTVSFDGGTIPLNQWAHIAVTRSGTAFKVFINGTATLSFTSSAGVYYNSGNISIGGNGGAAPARAYSGYIDDVRIIKGQALYTANFTPPGAELTTTI